MVVRYTGPGPLRLFSYVMGLSAAAIVYVSADFPETSRQKALMVAMVLVAGTLVLFILHYARVIYRAVNRRNSDHR